MVGRPKSMKNLFKPDKVRSKTKLGKAGYDNARENIDPHVKTGAITLKEGTIQNTPVNDKDIVNKKYLTDNYSTAHDLSINFLMDGGGAVLNTGVVGWLQIDFACTIKSATLLADQSGSIVVDIWKKLYFQYPPTDADSITAAAPPTISSAIKSYDAALTGWTINLIAGDILYFNIDSVATIEKCLIVLKIEET